MQMSLLITDCRGAIHNENKNNEKLQRRAKAHFQ